MSTLCCYKKDKALVAGLTLQEAIEDLHRRLGLCGDRERCRYKVKEAKNKTGSGKRAECLSVNNRIIPQTELETIEEIAQMRNAVCHEKNIGSEKAIDYQFDNHYYLEEVKKCLDFTNGFISKHSSPMGKCHCDCGICKQEEHYWKDINQENSKQEE